MPKNKDSFHNSTAKLTLTTLLLITTALSAQIPDRSFRQLSSKSPSELTLRNYRILAKDPNEADETNDSKTENKDDDLPISWDEINDRSHFKDFYLKKRFLIIDLDPTTLNSFFPFGYKYYLNLMAKKNSLQDGSQIENEFYFDMYIHNKKYTDKTEGEIVDWTSTSDVLSPLRIDHTTITPIKIKNSFEKIELSISENDCLSLFFFLDVKLETNVQIFPKRHDYYFDFRGNPGNSFSKAIDEYWGHSKDSLDIVFNDDEFEGDEIYLKVFCPYYSVFGKDQIVIKPKFLPFSSDFACMACQWFNIVKATFCKIFIN